MDAMCRVSVLIVTAFICSEFVATQDNTDTPNFTSKISCNFDRGWCQWRNTITSDDFNWKRGSGTDALQKRSGAASDHTGGGSYIFIKSRKVENRTARIQSPIFTISEKACFKFWYYMKGKTLGHLEVLLISNSQQTMHETVLWNLRGHQANKWRPAVIPIKPTNSSYIIIEAFDWELGKSGNIVVDDITMTLKTPNCSEIVPSYASQSGSSDEDELTITTTITKYENFTSSVYIPLFTRQTINNATTKPQFNYTYTTSVMKTRKNVTVTKTSLNTSLSPTRASVAFPTTFRMTKDVKYIFTSLTNRITPKSEKLNDDIVKSTTAEKTVVKVQSTAAASTSNASVAIGVVVGVLIFIGCAVALFVYLHRQKSRLPYSEKCSVVMTKLYPDVTVNTNISFQKLS